ncbi:anti-sigma regulatory factor (Ser/Thr protein kinase) [Paraburkholderia bannensis]|uniref:Anti-sigma regulatory factor (Ser/Thr protein kinase) n=1 Tax=Paraburkholderia bannensis TaxID=765414 RepID=A0A7W9TVK8_9BURK|nr:MULTISPECIES: ATP-binding SpoIIE family protein phosphatase [Paraburkholderia]MBB3257417.1 anti-sigma regulatory factor (Ser/Thr protein kinase) [Paraburkholderia sp. WP4_3_2]MBB6102187.1 anti-sigma regulatory factor (Ser/Thr protein kinase) [Paraburkholderia bannensis]
MESSLDGASGLAGGTHRSFEIGDASSVAFARRGAAQAAHLAGLDATDAGRLAIVLTEAATNILKHAGHGELLVRALERGVELIALDRGPGIADVRAAQSDGHSTAGTPGTGLGAINRLSDQLALWSQPGHGTVLRVLVQQAGGPRPARPAPEIGGVCVPYPGEDVCGDGWQAQADPGGFTIAVADGLGHGAQAHVAAAAALEVLRKRPGLTPGALMELSHAALRPTRGAALALARFDLVRSTVSFCGTGNISAVAYGTGKPNHGAQGHGATPRSSGGSGGSSAADTPGDMRSSYQIVSRNGIVGHTMRGTQEFELAWRDSGTLILHSDGVGTRWDLDAWPGLAHQSAVVIAAVLYRDFSRRRDDATVVVVKAQPGVQLTHEHAFAAHPH